MSYLRQIQLQKQLEEKAKETTENRENAEKELEEITKLIEMAKKIDANVADAEALFEESSQAMKVKDFKLALEKGLECKEKSKRIYADRVKAIVESSAGMLQLAEGIGKKVAEGEALVKQANEAVASEDLEKAVELARKSWQLTEKILHEHLSTRFSSAQSLIMVSKKAGKDVSVAEDLLSRARSALESNDYESALNFTKDCFQNVASELREDIESSLEETDSIVGFCTEMRANVSKIIPVVQRARSELKKGEFEKSLNSTKQAKVEAERTLQKCVEDRIESFDKVVASAEEINADVSDAKNILAESETALKDGSFREAVIKLKSAEEEARNAQFQKVLVTIATSRSKFVTAKNIGADLTKAMDLMEKSREAMKRENFKEAFEYAERTDEEVSKIVSEFETVESEIKSMQKSFALADEIGVDTTAAKKLLEKARIALQSRDFSKVLGLVKKSREAIDKAQLDRTMEAIESAESSLTLGQRMGIDLTEEDKILEKAVAAMKAKGFEASIKHAVDCRTSVDDSIDAHLSDAISTLQKEVKMVREGSVGARKLLDKAEAAYAREDFAKAFGFIDEGRNIVETSLTDFANRSLKAMELALNLAESLNIDIQTLRDKYDQAMESMDAGKYRQVVDVAERAIGDLATLSEKTFSIIEAKVVKAKKLEMEIEEMRGNLKKARLAIGTENYGTVFKSLTECDRLAENSLQMHEKAYKAISSSAALIAEAKKKRVDVKKSLEMLLAAKKALEKSKYDQALKLAGRSREKIEEMISKKDSSELLDAVGQRYQAAVELGFESKEINATIEQAKTALNEGKFDEAAELAGKSQKNVFSWFKENVSNLISTTQLLVVEGKGMGMNTSRADDLMTTSKGLFEAESFEEAAKNVKEAKEEMERLKNLSEKSTELIKNAENLMSAMDDMNVQTPRSKALLEEAKEKKEAQQFEEAIELAQRCQNELNGERDDYITATIASFEDVITKAREDGVNTKTAEELIQEAKELFEKGEYRKSLEIAMQSESEVERVGLQQDMASKAINTVTKKLKDFSAPAPVAEDLLNESGEAYEKGDYVRALELAIRGGDEFSKIKDSHESASSSLEKARGVMQMAKDVGADLGEVIPLLKEANKAMKEGDGGKARELAEDCMAKAVKSAETHLTSRLEEVTKGIERCEDLGIDTEGVRWMISEANALLDSENYAQAMDIIVGSEEAVRNGLKNRVDEVIENSEAAIIHATKMDADVTDSQNLIEEAKAAVEDGEFETAIELAEKSVEAVESKRRLEKEFFDLSYQATTTISSAKKFGIDVKGAEKTLIAALEIKETDRERSLKLAKEADESAKASMDAFSPVLEAVLEIKDPKIDEWSDAKITITNSGKALAKNIVVEILGAADVEGLELIPTLRATAFEELPVKIKITGTGEVPLAIKATTIRIFDEKAYEFETVATVSVGAREEIKVETAEESTNCPICKGAIKKGLKVVRCKKCGDVFHELCAKTAETCPKCEAAIS
ncbi:MAG: hypothetical protein KAR39_08450 [Thermoplasmata archaeon]|nr:hypothetical protein [Thermoplasmata archaeon]